MLATLNTEMFGQNYEITLILKEENFHRIVVQVQMNDVIVDERFVSPTQLRDPGKFLVDWLHSRYRGQFSRFAVETR